MLTQEVLKELLHYDPDTGIFTWKYRDRKWFVNNQAYPRWNTIYASNVAGYLRAYTGKKYSVISILHTDYKAHRLVFLYMTGEFPPEEVDHIDGNGTNNRWGNLRLVSRAENCRNQRLHITNSSGVSGVFLRSDTNCWRARISINHKMTNLGNFKDKFEAICVRKSAECKNNYHTNHGQVRPL